MVLNNQLINSPMEFRSKLTLPYRVNFGLELELDKVDSSEVRELVSRNIGGDFSVKNDKSLTTGMNAEINTPVLRNSKATWELLKKMGELLKKINASYDRCSFQVNFDGSLLPSVEDRVRFLKLYAMYEDIIYRFSKGEDSSYRDSLEEYASPIIITLKGVISINNDAVVDMFSNQKRYGICFKTKNCDLIEFRTPNMTDNVCLWQNYVTFFYHLLMLASSGKFDKREVDEYIERYSRIYILENYEKEKEEKALQLSKKLFCNSTDRINFMHQYLGK